MNSILARFLLIFVALIISHELLGHNVDQGKSLLNQLKEQVDIEDLSSIVALEKKAEKQSDNLCLSFVNYCKCNHYNLPANYSLDSINHYNRLAFEKLNLLTNDLSKLSKDELELYQFLKIKSTGWIVYNYLSDNKYDLALMYINNILKEGNFGDLPAFESEAYYSLGICYLHVKKGKEALENFRKAYSSYNKTTNQSPFSYNNIFRGMVHTFILMKDYDSVIVLNDSLRKMVENDYAKFKTKSKSVNNAYYQAVYAMNNEIALALVKKGNLQDVRRILDESKIIYDEHLNKNPLVRAYYQVEAQYHSAMKEHNKAKMYIQASLDSIHSVSLYNHIVGSFNPSENEIFESNKIYFGYQVRP